MSSFHRQLHNHTHTGSACHILLSPDNIAAVKVVASVIGRTNHSRRDEMVPSRRSQSRGRGQAVTLLPQKKKKREVLLSLCINVIFPRPTLLCMAIQVVFICVKVCSSVLIMLTCRLDSALWFCFHIIFYAPFARSHL